MKVRLFVGAGAVAATLFVAQSSSGVAAERLVLTPAQMDAVAAGLSVDLSSKSRTTGGASAASTGAQVTTNKKGNGVSIVVTTSDKGKGDHALTKPEKKKLKASKVTAKKKIKTVKAKAQHKIKVSKAKTQNRLEAAKANVQQRLKAAYARIGRAKH